MSDENRKQIDEMLPQGELLRTLLEQPLLSKGELNSILRERGIFIGDDRKRAMIPVATKTIFAPKEFEQMIDCLSDREDNQKITTQIIEWKSDQSLYKAFEDMPNIQNLINVDYQNYKLCGKPDFVAVNGNPDHLILNFEIERKDMSKSWREAKSTFPGSIEVTKIESDGEVKIVLTHTANETKEVAAQVSKGIIQNFKSNGYISQSTKVVKITFGKFDNDSRVKYLFSMSKNIKSPHLTFDNITNINFAPDPDIDKNDLPKDFQWMDGKVNNMSIDGKLLHSLIFLRNAPNRQVTHLYGIEAKYSFSIKGAIGTCVVAIEFIRSVRVELEDSQLEVNIKNLTFTSNSAKFTKSEAKSIILKEIELIKVKLFKEMNAVSPTTR